jgi:hypothetical protein
MTGLRESLVRVAAETEFLLLRLRLRSFHWKMVALQATGIPYRPPVRWVVRLATILAGIGASVGALIRLCESTIPP